MKAENINDFTHTIICVNFEKINETHHKSNMTINERKNTQGQPKNSVHKQRRNIRTRSESVVNFELIRCEFRNRVNYD